MLFVVVCYSRGYGHYSLESLQDFDVRQFPFHGQLKRDRAAQVTGIAGNDDGYSQHSPAFSSSWKRRAFCKPVMLDAVSMDRLEGPTTWHRNVTSTETPASSAFDQAMKVSLATKGVDTGNCYLN
ncbi:predicted protein [Plenodomus lingam JN3]|uniref:Uncharacterized protein n=1 Tax=Leptosphaeria maculans (strain JN3 / isolate v23.1.3 / race Av1-4-5-6-7-8) TaxID=985895 RepID=E4ZH01_LEPMJ|nr:predicted protein [Plenodomus lingam JN3]CBX90571.1 predicted protein [Plenodomus lingam JN3]